MTIRIIDDCVYFPVCFARENIVSVLEYPNHFCIDFAVCSNWMAYEESEIIYKNTMTADEIQIFYKWCQRHNIEIKQKASK